MSQKTTRWLLAAVQAIVGWEWLMSGGNKLLSGTFPSVMLPHMDKRKQEAETLPRCARKG